MLLLSSSFEMFTPMSLSSPRRHCQDRSLRRGVANESVRERQRGHQLEQRFNSGAWTTVHNGSGTSKASGVMAGSRGYRVRACNAAGCGAYSTIHTVWVDNIGGCNPPF